MRQVPRQQALRMVVCAALATVAAMAGGCDAGGAADAKAADAVRKGDYDAAAKEKNASPAISALAASAAASQQYASSLSACQNVNDQQVAVSQTLWQIGALTLTAERIARSSDELNKYRPDAALAELDRTVTLVKGDAAQAWSPTEGVELLTASASVARTNELKDKIAETQRTLADLKQQHDGLAVQARNLLDQSNAATGEQSVQLFRRSADARKQAADLAVRITQTEAALVPLQQDLALAENQVQQYTQMIENFAGERDEIEKSWRGVSAQIDQRLDYAALVYSRQDDPRFSSVASKARELAQLTADYDRQSEEYQRQLEGASALARDSISSSEKTIKALPRSQGSKGTTPEKLVQATLEPSVTRVMQGQIDYSTGSLLANRASLRALELRTAETVVRLGILLKQQAPESMNAAAIAKLRTNQGETMTRANETLTAAGELFGTVAEAPAASADTKRTATIGRMLALNASADLSQIAGDSAAAKQLLDEAKAVRDSLLQNGGTLPNLPAPLAADLPAPSAAEPPASAPATGPVEQD